MVEEAKRFFDARDQAVYDHAKAQAEIARASKPVAPPMPSGRPRPSVSSVRPLAVCQRCGSSDSVIILDKTTRFCESCMEVI